MISPQQRNYRKYIGLGGIISLAGLLVAFFFAGAGHGTFLPTKLLFPYAMMTTVGNQPIGYFFIALALLQFPIYGFICAWGINTDRIRNIILGLLLFHFCNVLIAFELSGELFS